MSIFGPPPGMNCEDAIHSIFLHYCRNGQSKNKSGDECTTMDGPSFVKMCKESPGLFKFVGRTDVDIIFSKSKPAGGLRRLAFENFLDSLLELAIMVYPLDNPTKALSILLAKYIFSLFDQPPAPASSNMIENIFGELSSN